MIVSGYLEISRLEGFTNKRVFYWPNRERDKGFLIIGFNWSPWVVRLGFRSRLGYFPQQEVLMATKKVTKRLEQTAKPKGKRKGLKKRLTVPSR